MITWNDILSQYHFQTNSYKEHCDPSDLKVTMESKFVVPNCTKNNQMMSGECISCVFVIDLRDFGIFKSL